LEIAGLTKEITELRILDNLLNGIGSKVNKLGGINNINNATGGKGGGNVIIPPASKAGLAEEAGTAGILAATGLNIKASLKTVASFDRVVNANSKYISRVKELINKGFITGPLFNPETGAFQYRPTEKGKKAKQAAATAALERSKQTKLNKTIVTKASPEVIDAAKTKLGEYTGKIPPKLNQQQGLFSSLFANLKTMMAGKSGHSLFSKEGIKEVGAELGLGKALGPLGKLGIVAGAVVVSMMALRKAVELLVEGVKHGAETYQHAAKTATNVEKYSGIEAAFKEIGMETPDLGLLQGQFNKKAGKFEAPGSDVILGAARAGQLGDVQQLQNMAVEFKEAMKDGAANARQMGEVARDNMRTQSKISAVGREWNTLLSQLAAFLSPLINAIATITKDFLAVGNDIMEIIMPLSSIFSLFVDCIIPVIDLFREMADTITEVINWIYEKLHIKRDNNPSFTKLLAGASANAGQSQSNSWEKLGFNMKGSSSEQHLATVSKNSTAMVGLLTKLVIQMSLVSRPGNPIVLVGLQNLP